MEEWKEYKLGDVVNVLDYKRVPLSSKERSNRKGVYPYYGAQGVIDYIDDYIFDGTYLLIAEDGENLKSQKQNIAQLATGKYWVNNHAHIVESNGLCDIRYLCYLLNTMDISGYITGSAQPKLNQANMTAISVILPSKNTQKRIADSLSFLDNKIEVNRRINENLEQQAQALFKSWFVDFEPFKDGEFVESELGMIPKGWRIGSLNDILVLQKNNIKRGVDTTLPYLPIDIIPMHSLGVTVFKDNSEAQSSLQTFEKNEIIVGAMRVYFHRVVIAPCKGVTRNTCFVLKPKNVDMWAYSILQCNQDEAIDYANRTSKGSTMPYAVWDTGFGNYKIVIPNLDVLRRFNNLLCPILEKLRDSYKENLVLSNIRNTLLPRLMSGKLNITI